MSFLHFKDTPNIHFTILCSVHSFWVIRIWVNFLNLAQADLTLAQHPIISVVH